MPTNGLLRRGLFDPWRQLESSAGQFVESKTDLQTDKSTSATQGAVGDFGRSTLPEWTSRRVATQCAVGQVTSALLHSACIAEFACTVWAEAHATANEL